MVKSQASSKSSGKSKRPASGKAADKFDALKTEIGKLDTTYPLLEAGEDGVLISVLAALYEYVERCAEAALILVQHQVTQKILRFLQTKNQNLALRTLTLLNPLVETSPFAYRVTKEYPNIQNLLVPFMKPGGKATNALLIIQALTLLRRLLADFRFVAKVRSFNGLNIICLHLKNPNVLIKKLALQNLQLLSIDWDVKRALTSMNEFNKVAMSLVKIPDPEVKTEMFVLLKSICSLEKNRDWARDKKILEATFALLLADCDDEVAEAAFEFLKEAMKRVKNVQFLKDKLWLRKLFEMSVDARELIQVKICELVASTSGLADNRRIYRELDIQKVLFDLMSQVPKSICPGSKAITRLCENGLLRQSLGAELQTIIVDYLIKASKLPNNESCFTTILEALTSLLRESADNVNLLVGGKEFKYLLKMIFKLEKESMARLACSDEADDTGSYVSNTRSGVSTKSRGCTGGGFVATDEDRRLYLEALWHVAQSKAEEMARADVLRLLSALMAPGNDVDVKQMAVKTLMALMKANNWPTAYSSWVSSSGVITLLQMLLEQHENCRNLAAIAISMIFQGKEHHLQTTLIDAGVVSFLERVFASSVHVAWPNPRERRALEDAVAAAASAAWAWRGMLFDESSMATDVGFWDGGGAEMERLRSIGARLFKSVEQTKTERTCSDGHREVVLVSVTPAFLEVRDHLLRSMKETPIPESTKVASALTKGSFLEMLKDGLETPTNEGEEPLEPVESVEPVEPSFPDSSLDAVGYFVLKRLAALTSPLLAAQAAAMMTSTRMGGAIMNDVMRTNHVTDVSHIKLRHGGNVVPIQEIETGSKVHRATFFKFLCDLLQVSCNIERGFGNAAESHVWNKVKIRTFLEDPPSIVEVDEEFFKFISSLLSDADIESSWIEPNQELILEKAIEETISIADSDSSLSLQHSSNCSCCSACRRPEEIPPEPIERMFRYVVDLTRHPGTLYLESSLAAKGYMGGKVW